MKLGFFRQIFEKCPNIKFNENLSSGSRVVACGRTDGQTDKHDEASSRFSQFCECSKRCLKFSEVSISPDSLSLCESQFTRGVGMSALLMVVSFVSGK
jgi:hypothetical protein